MSAVASTRSLKRSGSSTRLAYATTQVPVAVSKRRMARLNNCFQLFAGFVMLKRTMQTERLWQVFVIASTAALPMAARFWTGATNAMEAIVLWTSAVVIQEFLLRWFAILKDPRATRIGITLARDAMEFHVLTCHGQTWKNARSRNWDPRHVKKSPA